VFKSSASFTPSVPQVVPRHIAIVMDGNGRWATSRFLPRVAGHSRGVEAVRGTVKACAKRGVQYLTLFAFSSENWRRPAEEVSVLMTLFVNALEKEAADLARNNVRLRVVGDLSAFSPALRQAIARAEAATAQSTGLCLTVAANYGGRWDIMQAVSRLVRDRPDLSTSGNIAEHEFSSYLALSHAPEPDLFIRTGGEYRISNFLLWQMAYTELYFTNTYWPDFDANALDAAIHSFAARERRYGRTSAQLATPV
jgi:undecaprenyl diphosphate synthase